jgi:hypothetical protein
MADVEEFARQKDLMDHLPILKKGAILAQNPVSCRRKAISAFTARKTLYKLI